MLEAPPPFDVKLLPKLWCFGVEFGLNGTEGNSDNFKLRFAGNVKRETSQTILKADWLYTFATLNTVRSENRGLANVRHEWVRPGSPWSIFSSGQGEMDEFKAYDVRMGTHSGIGYNFYKTEKSIIKGRLGVGGSQEIGGKQDEWKWEGLAGFDVEHRFSKRYKFVASTEYFPDFTGLGDFRLQGKLAMEVLIDPDLNLSLKLGVLDRYDSTPDGKRPNDVEYFAVLLWKF